MDCFYIVALRLKNRQYNAVKLQQALTDFGCNIKMRLGLHEADGDFCSSDGLIILQACGEKEAVGNMVTGLDALEGVTAKLLDLND